MSARARRVPPVLVLLTAFALLAPVGLVPMAGAAHAVPERTSAEAKAEARLVAAHNEARRDRSRPALVVRGDLREAARGWSDQMARTGAFRHNPSVSHQICCWRTWGENIAWAGPVDAIGGWRPTADRIMRGWLESPGHRDNLLSTSFTEVGIGVTIADNGRMYATAVFRRPDGSTSPNRLPQPQPRDIDVACPSGRVPASGFTDVSSAQRRAVDCLAWWDVAKGTSATKFSPGRTVTRAQLASFVARTIEHSGGQLPAPDDHRFADVSPRHEHANAIHALARAGVISGYEDGTFRPQAPVTRGQMARMLVQAHEHCTGQRLPAPKRDWFFDDHGAHETPVNQAVEAGWAAGTGDGRFRPSASLQRGHLALFVTRWLDTLAADHGARLPG
ncbi:S-layer homology domain-containing protein [Egicoccus sp. AB-alg2]|uniref:CAP and S-layer homology domain-containing protein n=1 Tax=Egicoccus sp. AB-alg2 TaxID=3242693 RepID=UPI00359D8C8C